ncbi:MAG: tyrosine-type recombinase/integrase [Deltaproteobacteria bacterium]|nr:tyrosine-type recombinase/integrase [Deltaproteobacteria bacterium]
MTHGLPASHPSSGVIATLGDLLDHWIARQGERPDLSHHTLQGYTVAARHMITWGRDILLSRLDRETIERYRDACLRDGAAPRTVVADLKVLSLAWKWGLDLGHVPARALPHVTVKVDGYRLNHRTPSRDEVEKVLEHVTGDTRLAILLMATTGARVGEVADLRSRDLDPQHRRVSLTGKKRTRTIPRPPALADLILDPADRGDAPVFDLPGGYPRQYLYHALTHACDAAGVPRFGCHGLRRMVVDRFVRCRNVHPKVAATYLGHCEVIMLRIYASVGAEDLEEAAAATGLGSLVSCVEAAPGSEESIPVQVLGTKAS